jgi:hypothetical protein
MLSVSCLGVLVPVLGSDVRRVAVAAGGLATMGPATVLLLLLLRPQSVSSDTAGVAAPVSWWADKLLALGAGFALATALLFLYPLARRWHPRRAFVGFGAGAALVLALCGVMGLLCSATPYCLHTSASS